ncbi:hypothetical protein [Janthinobacterium sp. 17J80-10]|uniref:hypothetical protein n=1 Tax=Janthinobacterium sp. 17J80-10 TaxID=2497863 RepID=UPI0010056C03|nr:hypothetical protein [Janthinobacterium sp. 17J80-10]QAU32797.1 hypothetical protein EKL02_00655 [Janthinobacterium sp. 17J80-10]
MNPNLVAAAQHGSASVALRAEAYLASLHETSGNNLTANLANGMALVSGLLCGKPDNAPAQELHRALAKLVLAKMQRIARDTSMGRQQEAYPCFTS